MPDRHFLRSDIFTFTMVYSFYFRLLRMFKLFFVRYYIDFAIFLASRFFSRFETITQQEGKWQIASTLTKF